MNEFCCFLSLIAIFSLFSNCATTKGEKSYSLDDAIVYASNSTKEVLPQGTKVAVVNFSSSSLQLSEYVIEELSLALAGDKKLVVVDRRELELIRNEMNFQLSGEVDDASISSIGRKLGAQFIITGSFADTGTFYRFRTSAINVENATREAPISLRINKSDKQINHFHAKTTETGNPLIGDWIFEDKNYPDDVYFSFVSGNRVFGNFEAQFIGTYDDFLIKIAYSDDPTDQETFAYKLDGGKIYIFVEVAPYIFIRK